MVSSVDDAFLAHGELLVNRASSCSSVASAAKPKSGLLGRLKTERRHSVPE